MSIQSSHTASSGQAQLFSPFALRDVAFRNRIALSPMCQYAAHGDGLATDWHLVHYGARAIGGAGLILLEAAAVLANGRISPGDIGLWEDKHILPLQRVTDFINAQGSVAGIQLAHAGRKAATDLPVNGGKPLTAGSGGWPAIGASPEPFGAGYQEPLALDAEGLLSVRKAFSDAAARALAAGFKLIELHMAHGYLLHSFLSPLSNLRTDDYGGSFDSRVRFPLEVASAVRKVWPESLPLLVRISATDWVDGGWDLQQSIRFSSLLKKQGVDLIDVSSGGLLPDAVPPAAPGYQVPFAHAVREQAGMATGAVGLITGAEQAEEVLAAGSADLVFLGRELLRNPQWPLHAASVLGADIDWPVQYARARV
ncbi:NADH:flavin oxidoreductase/NADH oxidase [Candidatus Methylospira mobilis]|uniref:NADH:flavin oxidoreductase/NADH oxidase n=1 Tax=Candidatus Methylospira mobilis TaxID=1808979 RepID=A0A5Q0BFQ1_9GAMM|nr:NADH:flavin oxidoreductase/NADH oxidase [Candidatus Methylospira mobilis]QFY42695.1 NADH:flavin oxidoreductase/NADH oxidase [Candidatus Methylospira mobilis]WNV04187.1 NADH:flavin oxidoreductase/NADH oxidase [Candidatus Methylospira mobilis]